MSRPIETEVFLAMQEGGSVIIGAHCHVWEEGLVSAEWKKILCGTDWPLFTPVLSLEEWVNGIKEMKLPRPMKFLGLPGFTEDEKNMILGGNVARILDL